MFEESTVPTAEYVTVTGHQHGPTWVIDVSGEFDISACQLLRAEFDRAAAAACHRVVVDVGGVTFFDAGGLRSLEAAIATCGRELWLRSPSTPIRSIAELVGLGPLGWRGDPSEADVRIA